jgi:hypothetical protein
MSAPIDRDTLIKGCYKLIPGVETSYGYVPTRSAGITFCVLFFLSFIGHFVRAIQIRVWSSYVLAIAAIVEVIGWGARTWASQCPYNGTAFLMQITTLVISPVFVAAAIYVCFGYLIRRRGIEYSVLTPKVYLWIFCTCDTIALFVQAAGAGLASHAFNNGDSTEKGTRTVAGGIIFQLLTMAVFSFLVAVFELRARKVESTRNEKIILAAMSLSYVCIFIRSVYRAIALLQGFHGELTIHEKYFIALDGAMLVIALVVFNIFDPAVMIVKNLRSGATE